MGWWLSGEYIYGDEFLEIGEQHLSQLIEFDEEGVCRSSLIGRLGLLELHLEDQFFELGQHGNKIYNAQI